MKIEKISQDDLSAWQEGPVGDAVRECLETIYSTQYRMCLAAYWEENPWSEAQVKSLKKLKEVIEDIFEATQNDMMEIMEKLNDQPVRVEPD